ncbi:MAG: molybdenum ABC transporter ATP-binding protein, partial [Vicinamibacterales bacterium]
EIVPEIERVVLLHQGRIAGDGAKAEILTAAHLSRVFGAALRLDESDGFYYARPAESVAER